MGNITPKKKSTKLEGKEILGFHFKKIKLPSADRCQLLCHFNSNCKAWDYHIFNNDCKLYENNFSMIDNISHIYGLEIKRDDIPPEDVERPKMLAQN